MIITDCHRLKFATPTIYYLFADLATDSERMGFAKQLELYCSFGSHPNVLRFYGACEAPGMCIHIIILKYKIFI